MAKGQTNSAIVRDLKPRDCSMKTGVADRSRRETAKSRAGGELLRCQRLQRAGDNESGRNVEPHHPCWGTRPSRRPLSGTTVFTTTDSVFASLTNLLNGT